MIPDPKTFLDNPALLDEALAGGDIAPLLMVLVHLTGEAEWLDRLAPHIKGPWNFHEAAPDALRAACVMCCWITRKPAARYLPNRRRICCGVCFLLVSAPRCRKNTCR